MVVGAAAASDGITAIRQMHIDDFDGRTTVHDSSKLVAHLASVRRGPYGAFILSHTDDGPSLWVHINGDVAYLHFFPDNSGDHAGFQATDMTPPKCDEEVHFLQTDGGEGASFDMWRGALVPVVVAYEAASEFLAAPARPPRVIWAEL
jgi:hypothetical protein